MKANQATFPIATMVTDADESTETRQRYAS